MTFPTATTFLRPVGNSLHYLADIQRRDSIDKLMDEAEAVNADLVAAIAAGTGSTIAAVITALQQASNWAQDITVGAGATSVAQAPTTRKVVATLTAETLTLANAGSGLGFGSLTILTLPAGSIWRVESTVIDLAIPGGLTVIDGDDNGDFAVGIVTTAAGVLTSTEATFAAKTAVAYDTVIELRNDTAHDVDATSGAVSMFLNVTVDDTDVGDLSVTPATADITGTIEITLTDLGAIA